MRTTLALAVLSLAALVAPAVAAAETWRGETGQGRAVSVRTGDDGLVIRVRVSWRATCRHGHYISRTVFLPPLDVSETNSFQDGGTYRARVGEGYRARHTASVTGALGRRGHWRGSFSVRTRVTRRGKWVDTCELKTVRWHAKPA